MKPNKDPIYIKDLTPDPANLRRHGERSIALIEKSLKTVGAARSIVIDENNKILAGHGVVEGAGNIGMKGVRVIEADGKELIAVRRRGLTEEQKLALAIADNRTGELSEWAVEALMAIPAKKTAPWFQKAELTLLAEADSLSLNQIPESVQRNANQLAEMKAGRREQNRALSEKMDSEKYLVIVFANRLAKEKLLRELKLPIDERYIAATAIKLELVARNPIHAKSAKRGKGGMTG